MLKQELSSPKEVDELLASVVVRQYCLERKRKLWKEYLGFLLDRAPLRRESPGGDS